MAHILMQQMISNARKMIGQKVKVFAGSKIHHPQYVMDTFESFLSNKTQIILHLYQIYSHFSMLEDIIMNTEEEIVEINYIIFKLFPNIKELIISQPFPSTSYIFLFYRLKKVLQIYSRLL